MPTINRLPVVDELKGGDNFPIYSSDHGDARRSSLTLLLEFVNDNLDLPLQLQQKFTTQYQTTAMTAFAVVMLDTGEDIHIIMEPTGGTVTDMGITFPPVANLVDKQELLVSVTEIVTSLTRNPNGATVLGMPLTLASANEFFRMKFNIDTLTWYRIG